MFTQRKVEIVSDHARLISGATFGLQAIGCDIGNGVRYIDGRRQKVWFGSRGARQAASYYFGVIDAFRPGVTCDPGVETVRSELVDGAGWYGQEYNQGTADAQSFLSYGLKAHTFSLAALQAAPVIREGQYANVIFDTGAIRVGLARTGRADGEPYDNKATVDELRDGSWVTVREYEAK